MPNERRTSAPKPIRGVLFDLGGTLFGYNADSGGAIFSAISALGFDPSTADTLQALRQAFEEVSLSYSTRASYLHRDLFRDQLVRAAELLGVDAPADLLERFEADNLAKLITHMRPRPDAAEMLQALRDRLVYRAVVSNADDDFLGPLLERNGLGVLLDDWTSSEEAASCKPDARIYQYALEKSGIAADEVLFVGDSLQHDIAGASKVGMRSVLIDNGLDAAPLSYGLDAPAEPDFSIQTLTEILPIIDKFNGRS